MCPAVSRGPSQSEKRSRFRFSRYREYVCCSVTCPLGPVPGSLLGSFQNGDAARYLWLTPTYVGGSPSKNNTKRESSRASELTLAVRVSPPGIALPDAPNTRSIAPHCPCLLRSWPARLFSPQGPVNPALPTSGASHCSHLPIPLLALTKTLLGLRHAGRRSRQETNFQGCLLLTEHFQKNSYQNKRALSKGDDFSGRSGGQSLGFVSGGPTLKSFVSMNGKTGHHSASLTQNNNSVC